MPAGQTWKGHRGRGQMVHNLTALWVYECFKATPSWTAEGNLIKPRLYLWQGHNQSQLNGLLMMAPQSNHFEHNILIVVPATKYSWNSYTGFNSFAIHLFICLLYVAQLYSEQVLLFCNIGNRWADGQARTYCKLNWYFKDKSDLFQFNLYSKSNGIIPKS